MYQSLFIPVYLPSFLMSICQGAALLLIPLYALELGGSPAAAAMIFACRGLGNMVADIPAGYAAQKLGDAWVMRVGVGLMVAASLGAASADGLAELALFTFVIGLSMATWLLARLTFISDSVPTAFRGQALSSLAGLQRVGNFLGPVIGGYLVFHSSYTVAFVAIAGLSGLTLAILVLTAIRSRAQPQRSINADHRHDQASPQRSSQSLWALLKRHQTIFMTAGTVVFLLTLLRAARTLLVPLWGAYLGLNPAEIGMVVGISAAIDMMLFPAAGLIMDLYGRRVAGMGCLGLLSSGVLLIAFTDSLLMFTLAACFAGAGNGIGSGINMTLGTDFAPVNERGPFLGTWRLIGDAGSLVGPSLVAAIAGSIGLGPSILASAALGYLGLGVMAVFVPETLTKIEKSRDD